MTPPSGLQIMRNFENAAKKAGGTIEGQYAGWCKANYDQERMPDMGNGCVSFGLTMKFVTNAKEVWAFLQADGDGGNYLLTISEREAMKQEIRVTELVDKLSKDGFITLYVNFDTGKSTIKPDSAATLDSAAAALKAAADLKVEVAGHTDNVGRSEGGPAHRQRLRPDLACCRQPYRRRPREEPARGAGQEVSNAASGGVQPATPQRALRSGRRNDFRPRTDHGCPDCGAVRRWVATRESPTYRAVSTRSAARRLFATWATVGGQMDEVLR